MLTLFQEIVLLTINPQTGHLGSGNEISVRYALAGALLFDLALAHRIDTTVDAITVISNIPTGNPVQDGLLDALSRKNGPISVRDCVEQIFREGSDLEATALIELTEKGVIRQERSKLLWVIDIQRLHVVDGAPRALITSRLAQAVLEDEIPEIRDIMLVSLAHACGLLSSVLAQNQIEKRAEWIETLSKCETISRDVSSAIAAMLEDLARGSAGFGVARLA